MADVVDSVADAAVSVVDSAASAGAEAVHFWTKFAMHALCLSLVLVLGPEDPVEVGREGA